MSAILYGNLSVEIASRHGARITRMTLRQNPFDLLHQRRPEALPRQPILGREQQLADGLRAIQQRRPIEFHAGCGYGKTTLLQHIVASVSERYSTAGCIYLRADRDRVEDLLQQLVTELYSSDQPVKLTPGECAQLLGQAGLIIAVDDAPADPAQVGYLLDVLSGCTLVIGSAAGSRFVGAVRMIWPGCRSTLRSRCSQLAWADPRSEETRLNSSHVEISYAVFCLKKKKKAHNTTTLTNHTKHKHTRSTEKTR